MASEGQVEAKLCEMVAEQLNRGEFAGLRWADGMSDDDPDVELMVTDGETVYIMEVDVHLYPEPHP